MKYSWIFMVVLCIVFAGALAGFRLSDYANILSFSSDSSGSTSNQSNNSNSPSVDCKVSDGFIPASCPSVCQVASGNTQPSTPLLACPNIDRITCQNEGGIFSLGATVFCDFRDLTNPNNHQNCSVFCDPYFQ